ncbi:helix-turn-helix domain-containing protein [Nakamurella lactea]|uniref:helix-turn-helix domain-containing protein n=1 Tax=Nakamurella lactea TaxID=459515 RepID=UPI0038990A59
MSEAIAEEVRAATARVRLSGAALARHLGKPQPWVSRRLTGAVPFDVDELSAICDLLGIDVVDLMRDAVQARQSPRRHTPFGGSDHVVRPEGFEPPTF